MIGIYKITNKINNLSYIGQSINIERRWQEHQREKDNTLIHKAIREYGIQNFSFEIIEECSLDELNNKEIYWIKYYDTFNNGYNMTLGGSPNCVYDSEEIYNKYLELKNINHTAKYFQCHPQTVRNIVHSYGIFHNELQENKQIEQIDPLTLTTIKTYSSIQDAADKLQISRSAISMALNGKHKSAGNFLWKYAGENKDFNNIQIKSFKRKILQIDKDTNVILNTFDSMADAARFLGKDPKNGGSQICSVCKGKKKTIYGYKWKYAD